MVEAHPAPVTTRTAGPARTTSRQVAAELGISIKTVSNAYRRPDQLSPALREQVLATAARLGYPGPDPLAAGLRSGRVGAIGVAYANGLSYAFEDPVAVQLLAGAASAAEPAGASLLLVSGSADPDRAAAAVESALVDALLISSLAHDDPVLGAALGRGLPLVVVDQPHPSRLHALRPGTPWVGIDDRAGAIAAAEHLLALGHRRLGVVSFALTRTPVRGVAALADLTAQTASTYTVTAERLAGYRAAVDAAGLHWADVPVAHGNDSTVAEGELAARLVLAQEPRPTALLCLSDRLAEGAYRVASSLGLRVPEDLSLVGFDDAGRASSLSLTTVAHPHATKGRVATTALLDLIAGRDPPATTTLPVTLVVRSSTAPPASPLTRFVRQDVAT